MSLKSPMQQSGGILVVSLVFLLALTVVAIASLQSSSMNERMTNNLREMNTAFHAAETAIKAGEQYIESTATLESLEASAFLFPENALPDPFNSTIWQTTATKSVPLGQLQSPPRYMIETVGEFKDNANTKMNITNYDSEFGGDTVTVYRIVGRGTNSKGNTPILLESFYGKNF
ncbi:MAG: pilus assembly PilX family protein [Gammaproteobacteria bacterium]